MTRAERSARDFTAALVWTVFLASCAIFAGTAIYVAWSIWEVTR